ncbi:(R)-1-hydroxy-2-aminoethylphosphonate ammonia-lyase [Lichenifustis flavocetrariae]|uniref:Aspartate aminotransferase family protein n=1 Tax=Lichenifustis flavocetrariae TaxID=2949735 RepID=A0AA42CK87_9HYPH|nr:aspartate aminotransferase family protein [Lichenifustis flavocetrariae]MCW6508956.1 aspartate aminotransferase family protein [Lichenifustis flavocetrariae]
MPELRNSATATEPAAGDPASSEGDVNRSPRRAAWRAQLDAETQALLDADERWFLHQSLSTPCLDVIERAEGAWLTDVEGRRILDFHGNSVHQLGHGHPRVVAAVKAALDTLPFCPRRYTNRAAIDLAQRLAGLAPGGLEKVLFAPSGAAAIGMALKLARYATGRHKTLSFWDAFHGANLDTIGIGGEALFRRDLGPMMPGAEHLPPLHLAARLFGDDRPFERLADYVDYTLAIQGDVAALIAEPMRWTTVEPPPPGFWPRVRDSCTRHGALLIFDEIPSCLARTGTMFACEQAGATPDVLVIGKGLGGGVMPMAAIMADARLDCAPQAALGHYTHEKSPVGCAAALATLDVIAEENLVARARELGRVGLDLLEDLKGRHAGVRDVRGFGCYFGLEIGGPDAEARADRLLYACLTRGLSFKLGGGTVVTLCPPLTITDDEFAQAFTILGHALGEV